MRKQAKRKALSPAWLLLAGGVAVVLLSSAGADAGGAVAGQESTQPWEMVLFGGPGDQYGYSIAVRGNQVFVGSWCEEGLLRSYPIPISTTSLWALSHLKRYHQSLATTDTNLYSIGSAYPPICGASDGVGGTEPKAAFSRYSMEGGLLNCGSLNFFPYRGYEWYFASVATQEAGVDYVYAGGTAEQTGSYLSGPFVLAKYDATGSILDSVSEPFITLGSYWPGSWDNPWGTSCIRGLIVLNGYLYAAGESWLPYSGEDKGSFNVGERPMLMKYDLDLVRVWKRRADIAPGYQGYSGRFSSLTALNDCVFAAGGAIPTGGTDDLDFLVEKFDEDGNRIWSTSWGGPYEDVLRGITAVGNRVFAVGYSYETPRTHDKDGKSDAFIFEIDPVSGSWLLVDRIGGEGVEWATGVATDGHDLYIVGNATSFESIEGNAVGDLEIMLIHYPLHSAYEFYGFDSPVDNQPTVNIAKAGSTIPVKWRITKPDGTPVEDTASFVSLTSYQVGCGDMEGSPLEELETYSGASGLQYFGDGYWQFNWKTPKSYARQCRVMVLTLADGSTHTAYFSFK